MAFPDVGRDHEINNELLLFRELFNTKSKYRNYLLISHGGRITQHLVEFSAYCKKGIVPTYKEDFKYFLDECEFIPKSIRIIILQFYDFRKNFDYSLKYEKELNHAMVSYLETFYNILDWFELFYRMEFYDEKKKFEEISKTKTTLKKKINKLKSQTGIGDKNINIDNDFEENSQDDINLILNKIEMCAPEIYAVLIKILESNKKVIKNQEREHQEHEDQKQQLNNIEDKIDNLTEQLKVYNESLATRRESIQGKLEDAKDNEDKKEKLYNEFNHKAAKELKENIKDYADKNEYDEEEERVIDSLGECAWNKLEKDSQMFLVTSEITYNHLCDLGNKVDYSGVCLSVTKALEIELKKIFYKGFIDFLDENYEYSEYHSSFFNHDIIQKGNLKKETKWTLGGIPYILGANKNKKLEPEIHENNASKLLEYSKHALFDPNKHSDDEIKKTLKFYGSKIDSITQKYRNKAAHTYRIKDSKAKQCLDYVIDVKRFLGCMLDSFDKEHGD
ncbi:MAG: hypothetical protein E7Z79_08255 [Methanobrevibacter thaueri]|uniref:Uncharacterized protein n=1 Tax=Methanobrevibacter thaueri TaxID=190975 RepID=A0A8T3VGM0_9EURY|nr:hypothetical protein [Methanobrevibacter thaueri]MBE6502414.1 hypothetical protein [Methanobrevibacter thaueri]